jgi:hypothetical protein
MQGERAADRQTFGAVAGGHRLFVAQSHLANHQARTPAFSDAT